MDIRDYVCDMLTKTSREFNRGNWEGYKFVTRTFDDISTFTDDEDTIFMAHFLMSVNIRFFEKQENKEGYEEYLKNVGKNITGIKDAYASKNSSNLNQALRDFAVLIRNRWIELPELKKIIEINT